jgi:diacylglycerol O-acyltransferase / wax synthase
VEHLTGLDASFLEAEDSDPHVSLALGSVSVMEGPLPDDNALVSTLRQRMLTVPPVPASAAEAPVRCCRA